MKWTTQEMDMYLSSKEYVDTAIIPLIPINWSKDVKGTVSMGEFTSILVDEIERQFKGRLFQMAPFTYLTEEGEESKITRLKAWDNHFFENGFKHVIYITSDASWKKSEKELPDMLVWIPSLSLESMDNTYAKEIISQQMKQILPLITSKWQEDPIER
ncbi:MAG: YpiF family protein [Bacillus sp. (in: Bacteria)]|nr:YpiF family protein [Bacillus sp. (in: firmicutes)]